MKDDVDTGEDLAETIGVANIADDELGVGGKIVGGAGGMHLGGEVVEDANVVPGGEEAIGEMRADEAGTTGDKDLFAHKAAAVSSRSGST